MAIRGNPKGNPLPYPVEVPRFGRHSGPDIDQGHVYASAADRALASACATRPIPMRILRCSIHDLSVLPPGGGRACAVVTTGLRFAEVATRFAAVSLSAR